MTEVISGEFYYPFELYIEAPRFVSVSGTATISYEAERYSKEDGWSIEGLRVSDMTIEEALNEEGESTAVNSEEILTVATYLDSKRSDVFIDKALDDAAERAFY